MVDVTLVPPGAFGYVPTPALVAPLEFTLRRDDYAALGGHMEAIVSDGRGPRTSRRALLMSGPTASTTADGSRLHLQHGPIDLIIEAWGDAADVADAYRRAWVRFQPLLDELVEELPSLRRPLDDELPGPASPVGRRMAAAVRPFGDRFITPMAAVAGAVADEICAAMVAGGDLRRVYVNDGGDIALHLSPGESFDVGLVPVPQPAGAAREGDRARARADPRRGDERPARPELLARDRRRGDRARR